MSDPMMFMFGFSAGWAQLATFYIVFHHLKHHRVDEPEEVTE